MKIHILGSGTPTPSLRRMCSGYVVEVGADVILFDHGFGAHHRLLELGIPATRVTHVFLSHMHYDHYGDYPRLVLTHWDQGANKIPELKVYGPPPLGNINRVLFEEGGAFWPDLVSRTSCEASLDVYEARGGHLPRPKPMPQIEEVRSGQVVEGNGWTVEVVAVRHFQPYLISLGFKLVTAEGSFVYSGDTGPCPGIRKLAQDCDVLVHMCHYLTGSELSPHFAVHTMGHMELAQLAADIHVRSLVATHFTEQMDTPGQHERIVAEMSSIYKGDLYLGEDLMEIPLRKPHLKRLI